MGEKTLLRTPENRERIRRAFKLLMVGPDGGGKTSILFGLKADQVRAHLNNAPQVSELISDQPDQPDQISTRHLKSIFAASS